VTPEEKIEKRIDELVAIYDRSPVEIKMLITECRKGNLNLGLTAFIRALLSLSPVPLTPVEIKNYAILADIRKKAK